MPLQHRISLLPHEAEMVSPHLAMANEDGRITFFNASGPIYTFEQADEAARRLAAALLSEPRLGLATPTQLGKALGRHRSRVHAFRNRYRAAGVEGVEVQRRGPRGATKLKEERLGRAQALLDEGRSMRAVAAALALSEGTIRKAVREGRLHVAGRTSPVTEAAASAESAAVAEPSGPEAELTTARERTDADAACVGGIATHREAERALAAAGGLVEAVPRFEPAEGVAKAGVLVAVPALIGQGLVEVGRAVYGKLSDGYYGLCTMLLVFGLMALIRIKSPEGLGQHTPGEFGRVLGLDRAPEPKTVRRKLAELGERALGAVFAGAFTTRWAEECPEALGYLYIDGHVRPYHGRTHTLPKTHVQRRRLCMPATTDYWVNDAQAEPLMFVTAAANEGLLAMMEQELLPAIRTLAGEGRRVTLIFDREGWSPQRFRAWREQGFDVITYRKGAYRPWQRRAFRETEVEVQGRKLTYWLAERWLRLGKGFRVREIRRLCDDGHQTSVVTTRRDLSTEAVALRMFSRWQQENFFRYMRHEFALDHLCTHAVEPADPTRTVPNPVIKERKRELARLRAELAKAEQAYGREAHENPEQRVRTVRGFKISHAALGRTITALREQCERLRAEIAALPKRVPVQETRDGEPIVQLERERKIITDTLKMVAYRAETQLANLVGPLLPWREDEARKFLRRVFELPADLLPDYEQRTLLVHLHALPTPRDNAALAALCEVLNDLETCYPDTELRMVFRATQVARGSR